MLATGTPLFRHFAATTVRFVAQERAALSPQARRSRLVSTASGYLLSAADLQAEREGFEPPGLIGLPLSRRVHLSALPPFRHRGYRPGCNTAGVIDRRGLIERIAVIGAFECAPSTRSSSPARTRRGAPTCLTSPAVTPCCAAQVSTSTGRSPSAWPGRCPPPTSSCSSSAAAVVGVPPAVDVTPTTDGSVVELAGARLPAAPVPHDPRPCARRGGCDAVVRSVDRRRASRRRPARGVAGRHRGGVRGRSRPTAAGERRLRRGGGRRRS